MVVVLVLNKSLLWNRSMKYVICPGDLGLFVGRLERLGRIPLQDDRHRNRFVIFKAVVYGAHGGGGA